MVTASRPDLSDSGQTQLKAVIRTEDVHKYYELGELPETIEPEKP